MNKLPLSKTHPELAKEWHPTKNGNLTPNDVTFGSNRKVWWKCKKSHEWEACCDKRSISKRNRPFCCNQRVCKDNCLLFLFPEIAKEWHPTKNGDLAPSNIVAGSNKEIWWKCKKGHVWKASCHQRTSKKCHGCYNCSGYRSKKRTLLNKDNSLANKFPEIAKEWHPTKNGDLTPSDIVAGSGKEIWWECKKGHVWKASCGQRTSKKRGCAFCANKKVCKDNSLAKFPEIFKEWHPTKNGNLTPHKIIARSTKLFWWKCKKGHEWKTSCRHRTLYFKTGCPICKESKGEKKIAEILDNLELKFKRQVKLSKCKNKKCLPFDFLIRIEDKKGFLIEYQGAQHYKPIKRSKHWSNEKAKKYFLEIQKRDKIKREYATKYNIPLLIIPYWDFDKIEELILDYVRQIKT